MTHTIGIAQTHLTDREIAILVAVAQGCTNAQIAKQLGTATPTVQSHLKRIKVRLNARNRAHAVALGIAKGYIKAIPKAAGVR